MANGSIEEVREKVYSANGWNEYAKLVLSELKRLDENDRKLAQQATDNAKEIAAIKARENFVEIQTDKVVEVKEKGTLDWKLATGLFLALEIIMKLIELLAGFIQNIPIG